MVNVYDALDGLGLGSRRDSTVQVRSLLETVVVDENTARANSETL